MDKFLHDENLKLLHQRLMETTDEKNVRSFTISSPSMRPITAGGS